MKKKHPHKTRKQTRYVHSQKGSLVALSLSLSG